MFYQGSIDTNLRFGDVVKGYVSLIPKLTKPFGNMSIEIQNPQFSVVLDPCCEIGKGTILLSPLEEISPQLLDIPILSADATGKDLLLLNTEQQAKDYFYPTIWNELSVENKEESLTDKPEYVWKSFFIYEGNSIFPQYTIKRKKKYRQVIEQSTQLPRYEEVAEAAVFSISHRMINFKAIYRVNCEDVTSSKPGKPASEAILSSIVLQLSIETRNLLRQKMAYYFGKPPPEDEVET